MTTVDSSIINDIRTATSRSDDADALLASLEQKLQERQDFHRLFDAQLLRARHRLGLPVTQPSSLEDIPAEHQAEFRAAYVAAARNAGQLLLSAGHLAEAWPYFRTIGEPQALQSAIEAMAVPDEPDADFDDLMNLALYEGAHMVQGLTWLLQTHGTCNTVTTLTQLQQQMTFEERRQSAALLVRQIYSDLQYSLRADLESRRPGLPAQASLRELMQGQDVLFADGNYHVDVSHLHSIVGFARSLTSDDAELEQAIELCEYGARLAEPLRYPGNAPFEDYYATHLIFLTALAGRDIDSALDEFEQQMQQATDDSSRRLAALVVLDLGQRCDREDRSLAAVAPVLSAVEEPGGFSFTSLCVEQGRLDLLEQTAEANDDVIAWTIARLSQQA